MALKVLDQISVAGSGVNEDRIGAAGDLAWVIDGATDVLEAPLTRAATDAEWIAIELDAELHAHAASPGCGFAMLPDHLTTTIAESFAIAARRQPRARHEHPSAAAIIAKHSAGVLSYIAVGDCRMIAATEDGIARCGPSADMAGDRILEASIRAHIERRGGEPDPPQLDELMRGKLQNLRDHMNLESGYGVFSVTPVPEHFVRTGFLSLPPGARVLLASDGFMRLVDVFARYTDESLLAAANQHGLAALLAELRGLESADPQLKRHLRVKASDDASALLLETTA